MRAMKFSRVGSRVVASAWLMLTPLLGCSGGEEAEATETPATTAAPTPPTTATAEPSAVPEPEPEPTPAPAPGPTIVELNATVGTEAQPGWVDLLHTVQTTVATTSAYRDELRQIGFLFDGDLTTAWNSATMPEGDTSPRSIYVRVPAGARVHAIDLTAGFTKVQGASDLFAGNRRLRRVRVRHPGGEVLATLDSEQRAMQRIPLEGGPGDYEIEILEWVQGTRPTWRELCISELRVWGEADASAPRAAAATPLLGVLPGSVVNAELAAGGAELDGLAEGEEGEDGLEGDDFDDESEPANAAPVIAQRASGLQITRLELAPAMDGRTPLEPRTTYSKTEDDQVYCYFELTNPDRTENTVTLAWEDSSGGSRGAPTQITVNANRRFINFRYTSVSWRRPGTYYCVVRQGTDELGRIPFTVTE